MLAPPKLGQSVASGGSEHGIQSERPAPGLEHLQAVADELLPEKATLSDVRWSSIFGSACGSPSDTAAATSFSAAMPRTFIRRPAARE